MEKKLKNLLVNAFEASPPDRKEAFLSQIVFRTYEEPSRKMMLFTQIGYIHKSAWLGALAVFCAILYVVLNAEEHTVFLVSALMPFLALAVLVEGGRSCRYRMSELEAATRYSIRSIVFCRMWILGVFDLIIMLLLILTTRPYTEYGLLLSAAYILLPYLLTMWMGLMIELSRFGRETPYAAVTISMTISVSLILLVNSNSFVLEPDYGIWWEIVTMLLMIATILKWKDKMSLLEEPVWN